MATVIITGWQEGLQKISMTKLIQTHTSLGLNGAKSVTDRVLDGESVALTVAGNREAESLVNHLKAVGAEAEVVLE